MLPGDVQYSAESVWLHFVTALKGQLTFFFAKSCAARKA